MGNSVAVRITADGGTDVNPDSHLINPRLPRRYASRKDGDLPLLFKEGTQGWLTSECGQALD